MANPFLSCGSKDGSLSTLDVRSDDPINRRQNGRWHPTVSLVVRNRSLTARRT
jgi:hypothetical protein